MRIIDFRDESEFGGYEYYRVDGIPVRVVLSPDGFKVGADTVDSSTGELVRSASLISRTETDPFSDEISRDEFYALCEELVKR